MFYKVLLQFERSTTGLQRRGLYINTAPAACLARRPSYVERMKLPDMYAVQRVGDRWLFVSVNEWSLAAGRTFESREIDVFLVGGDLLIRHRYPRARRSRGA